MVERTAVYEAITKEDEYAKAWAKGKKSVDGSVPDHLVSRQTGLPFSSMEWIVFAEKYLAEAKEAYANFLPDMNIVNVRLLKAASLLVSALQVGANQSDLDKIAGVSSTNFPVQRGGLSAFKKYTEENPSFAGDKAWITKGKLYIWCHDYVWWLIALQFAIVIAVIYFSR